LKAAIQLFTQFRPREGPMRDPGSGMVAFGQNQTFNLAKVND
jgi:hypothetical protein